MKKVMGLALLALAAAGCKSGLPEHDGIEVRVKPGHRHSRYCGHYKVGMKWYYTGYVHRHGAGCGHELVEGAWIIEE